MSTPVTGVLTIFHQCNPRNLLFVRETPITYADIAMS